MNFQYEHAVSHRKAESAALSYGVMGNPLMGTEDFTLCIHEIAFRCHDSCLVLDKGSVILIRHEADFLGILLFCYRKTDFCCNLTNLIFCVVSDRHQRMRKLLLGQIIQCIRLVFCRCYRICNRIPSIGKLFDSCIMSGRNVVRSNRKTALKQRFPFHIAVAGDTRVRCSAAEIFVREIVHDVLTELFFEVHDIIRNVQHLCHAPCIINSRKAATAPVFLLDCLGLILPDLHGHPDDIVSCFFQEIRCHRGIYAAGHSNDYFLFSHT